MWCLQNHRAYHMSCGMNACRVPVLRCPYHNARTMVSMPECLRRHLTCSASVQFPTCYVLCPVPCATPCLHPVLHPAPCPTPCLQERRAMEKAQHEKEAMERAKAEKIQQANEVHLTI